MKDTVTRYVATYIAKDGMRTLMQAMQGRNTYATPEQAQARIDAIYTNGNNSASMLASIWGENPQCEVRPVECYPGHYDPITCYFDTEAIDA